SSVEPALSSRSPRLMRAAMRPSAAPSAAAVSAGSLPPAKAPSTSRPVLSCAGLPVFMVNSIGFFLVLMPGSDCRRLWPVRNASVKDAFHRTRAPWRRVFSPILDDSPDDLPACAATGIRADGGRSVRRAVRDPDLHRAHPPARPGGGRA